MDIDIPEQLARGDISGEVIVSFDQPTEVKVRWDFANPKSGIKLISTIAGYVSGGWGYAFLEKDGLVYTIELASNPKVKVLISDTGDKW